MWPSVLPRHPQAALLLILALAVCFCALLAHADDRTHKYAADEEVTVWVNRVGPYDNPQETYSYDILGLCKPAMKVIRHKASSLGVVLEGDQVSDSGIPIAFQREVTSTPLCSQTFTADSAEALSRAIRRDYWYQLYVDELPVWAMVGPRAEPGGPALVYTHRHFTVATNGDRVIEVNLTSSHPRAVTDGAAVQLSYSVSWVKTTKSFKHRFDRYLDSDFFEHKVHWIALFNSSVMVVFLCTVVGLILLRTLRSDFARHALSEDNLDLDLVIDESGWKQVHNDVLRPPPHLPLLAGIVGSGAQLLALCLSGAVAVGLFGTLYDERGRLMMTVLALYCASALLAGIVSGRFYKSVCDPRRAAGWKAAMFYTAALLPVLAFVVQCVLNGVALGYGSESQAAVAPATMARVAMIWLCVQCPLVVLGTLIGRALTAQAQQRYSYTMRPIPLLPWYKRSWVVALVAAAMPFAAIFIEIHFIFTSIWSYKFYYVYGFMFVVFVITVVVTLCVSVLATYVVLNREDWRWQWVSAGIGLGMAGYVAAYAVYYLVAKTRMTGALQLSYFFGYVALFCAAVGVLTSAVAHLGARWFVGRIYQTKTD
jgi:transmembrane 9 superfamily protein 3